MAWQEVKLDGTTAHLGGIEKLAIAGGVKCHWVELQKGEGDASDVHDAMHILLVMCAGCITSFLRRASAAKLQGKPPLAGQRGLCRPLSKSCGLPRTS